MTEFKMDSDGTLCRYSFMIGYIEWIGWWIGGRHRSFFFGGWQVKTASKLFGRNSTLNRKFDYNKWDIRNLSSTKVNTHPISHMMLSSNWISPLRTNFHTLRFKPFISSAWAYFTAVTVPMHVHLYFPCIKLKYMGGMTLTLGYLIHQSIGSWMQIDKSTSVYPNVQQKESLVVSYSQYHRPYQQPLECLFYTRCQHCCKSQSFGSTLRNGSILNEN